MHRKSLSSAIRSIVETLETRQLLHGGFSAQVDFRPAGTATPAGYVADNGAAYGDRGNGFTYGWNANNSANMRIRKSSLSPDARYDTLEHMQKGGNFTWEIAVPNGDYTVHVVSGDAGYTDSIYKLNVEDVLTVDGTPTSSKHWIEGTKTVTVTDGNLTITNAGGASNNRIAFVDISAFDDHPVIGISASMATTAESAEVPGQFLLTRTGSLSEPLSVTYTIGGSATADGDYDALSGVATFAAGSDTATIDIVARADDAAEGDETVMLTLNQDAEYEVDEAAGSETVTIFDNQLSPNAASGFVQRINFQPDGTDVPDYYKADIGSPFGLHKNGLTYGWNGNNTGSTRDRNAANSPDQRYDTFIHMQKAGNWIWEIAVPNGTYTVRVVAGDATATDSLYKIRVEGITTVKGTPTTANPWVEGTSTITVSDGRLTLSNTSDAQNNKIAFVEISSGTAPIPVVRLAASDANASESDPGEFAVTRSGDLSLPLTVNYTIAGSATNGVDYDTLSGAVSFEAGSAQALISISPIQDSTAEGTEAVSIKLSTSSSYTLAQKFSASVNITDDDVNNTTLGSLKWTTAKSSPQLRAEATGASIGGKLYAFGGYQDSTYHPIARVDVYDPIANSWARKGDMPNALTHAGTTTDGTFAYLAGGYPGDPTKGQTFSTTTVWKYDPSADKWTTIKPLPSARGAGNLQYLNGKLYFFGGSDSSRKDRAETYSLDLKTAGANWVQLASMPAARNHVGGATLNGMIYAIGGQQFQDANSQFKGDVYRYDPSTNKWTTVASLINQPRSHINGATVVYNGHIIAMGGEGPGRVALRNVESYDPFTGKWSALAPLPSGRSSGIGAVLNGKLVFNSGYSGQFNSQTWIGTFS